MVFFCEGFQKRAISRLCGFMLICVGMATAMDSNAMVFEVTTTRDFADSNLADGVCSGAPTEVRCSLRAAIQSANVNLGVDTVLIPAGVYDLTLSGFNEDNALTGDLDIRDTVIIQGYGATRPVINGGYRDRVFDIQSLPGSTTKLFIENLTIQSGMASFDELPNGGGILVREHSILHASRCLFLDNVAQFGGAISTREGSYAELSENDYENNWIYGIYGFDIAAGGTALHTHQSRVDIKQSSFSNNGSLFTGSVIYSDFGQLFISDTTISNNEGTGVYAEISDVYLRNTTIADQTGYGFRVYAPSPMLAVTMKNSINANNHMADCDFSAAAQGDLEGPNLDSDGSCLLNRAQGGLPSTDPRLDPLSYATNGVGYRPLSLFSPAIDRGSVLALDSQVKACTSIDQLGQVRNRDGNGDGDARCDLGAIER